MYVYVLRTAIIMNYENNQRRQWSSRDVACETGKGHFQRGVGEPVILCTCQGMLSSSCLQSTGLGWVSLSQSFRREGGSWWAPSSVCRSWWGRECRVQRHPNPCCTSFPVVPSLTCKWRSCKLGSCKSGPCKSESCKWGQPWSIAAPFWVKA